MRLYHTTSASVLEEILADGFQEGDTVRLAETPSALPANGNSQAHILFEIPEEAIRQFEFDHLGSPGREFAVPVEVLNRYPILATRTGSSPVKQGTPRPPAAEKGAGPSAPEPAPRRLPKRAILLAVLIVLFGIGGYAIYATTRGDEDTTKGGGDESRPSSESKGVSQKPKSEPTPPKRSSTESAAVGTPEHGRLVRGVPFPAAGSNHFTWDVDNQSSPNPRSRRYATDYVVQAVQRAISRYRKRHRRAPKVGIGDLSRPHGGPFGPQNSTHENGLVVAVLYPRSDSQETQAGFLKDVDRGLAQALLKEFAKAGARTVFLDPHLGLTVPKGMIQSASREPRMHIGFPKRD